MVELFSSNQFLLKVVCVSYIESKKMIECHKKNDNNNESDPRMSLMAGEVGQAHLYDSLSPPEKKYTIKTD